MRVRGGGVQKGLAHDRKSCARPMVARGVGPGGGCPPSRPKKIFSISNAEPCFIVHLKVKNMYSLQLKNFKIITCKGLITRISRPKGVLYN